MEEFFLSSLFSTQNEILILNKPICSDFIQNFKEQELNEKNILILFC
jgi:hypothetical protein